MGPRLRLRSGRSLPISMYLRGFGELVAALEERRIPVSDEFLATAQRRRG